MTGTGYPEMLQTWLFPRLQEDEPEDFIMQQDGASPHFRLDVRWLNDVLPHRWVGRGAHEDLIFCPWRARSPDLTPCDYFLWGYVKDKVCHHNRRAYLIWRTELPRLLRPHLTCWSDCDRNWTIATLCAMWPRVHTSNVCRHVSYTSRNILSLQLVFIILFAILVNIINFQSAPIILIHAVFCYWLILESFGYAFVYQRYELYNFSQMILKKLLFEM